MPDVSLTMQKQYAQSAKEDKCLFQLIQVNKKATTDESN